MSGLTSMTSTSWSSLKTRETKHVGDDGVHWDLTKNMCKQEGQVGQWRHVALSLESNGTKTQRKLQYFYIIFLYFWNTVIRWQSQDYATNIETNGFQHQTFFEGSSAGSPPGSAVRRPPSCHQSVLEGGERVVSSLTYRRSIQNLQGKPSGWSHMWDLQASAVEDLTSRGISSNVSDCKLAKYFLAQIFIYLFIYLYIYQTLFYKSSVFCPKHKIRSCSPLEPPGEWLGSSA